MSEPSRNGERVIVQVIDSATKYIKSCALVDNCKSAETIAKWFFTEWCLIYGFPSRITCDQGGEFVNKFNASLCAAMGMALRATSPYHLMSNGQAENPHRRYVEMLRMCGNKEDWADWIAQADWVVNTHTPRMMRVSPFFLTFGQHPLTVVGIAAGLMESMSMLKDHGEWYFGLMAARTGAAMLEGRARGAPTVEELELGRKQLLQVGQLVLVKLAAGKLGERQQGPYRVVKVHDGVTTELVNVSDPGDVLTRNGALGALSRTDLRGGAQPIVVEAILAERGQAPHKDYLLCWRGYSPEHDLWVAQDKVHAAQLVAAWNKLPARVHRAQSKAATEGTSAEVKSAEGGATVSVSGAELIQVERVVEARHTRSGASYLVVPVGSTQQRWVRESEVANPEALKA